MTAKRWSGRRGGRVWTARPWGVLPDDGAAGTAPALFSTLCLRVSAGSESLSANPPPGHPMETFGAAKTLSGWRKQTVDPGATPWTITTTEDGVVDWISVCATGPDVEVHYFQLPARRKRLIWEGLAVVLNDGQWHHIVFTQADMGPVSVGNPITDAKFEASIKLYVDGLEYPFTTTDHGGDITGELGPAGLIGIWSNPDVPFRHAYGLVDETAVWSAALDLETIQAIGANRQPVDWSFNPDGAFVPFRRNQWRMGEGFAAPTMIDVLGDMDLTTASIGAGNVSSDVPNPFGQ